MYKSLSYSAIYIQGNTDVKLYCIDITNKSAFQNKQNNFNINTTITRFLRVCFYLFQIFLKWIFSL